MPDHPGFEYWKVDDLAHPFPVGEISVSWGDEDSANATADLTLPKALPDNQSGNPDTVAERSVGITDSAKLWFALECKADAQGKVTCEALLAGKHVHWFPDHGETAPGPEHSIRLTAVDLAGNGRKEALDAHGPHCDLFVAHWWQDAAKGTIKVELSVWHFKQSPREFLDYRKQLEKQSEYAPPQGHWHMPPPYPPAPPHPAPPPKPDSGDGP